MSSEDAKERKKFRKLVMQKISIPVNRMLDPIVFMANLRLSTGVSFRAVSLTPSYCLLTE